VEANPAVREDEQVSGAVGEHMQMHIAALRNLDPALLKILGQPALGLTPDMPPPPQDAGALPPGAMPPPGEELPPPMEGGPIADAMAGNPPGAPNLPQPAQPPPGTPPLN